MFEIVNTCDNYSTVILAKRSIDCSIITKEEFIAALTEDINAAVASFNEVSVPKQIEYLTKRNKENIEAKRAVTITRAIAYAEKKWKTEKRRNQYINDVIADLESRISNYEPHPSGLDFFDMNGNCDTTMGISSNCIISVNRFNNESLGRCYDTLLDTCYFKKAIGWQFEYEANNLTYGSSFRPSIKLLFDGETTNEITKSKNSLNKAVFNFYKNTDCPGD